MQYRKLKSEELLKIATLGELIKSGYKSEPIKEELRKNLILKKKSGENIFEGIWGYEDTVIPDIERAILSRHNPTLVPGRLRIIPLAKARGLRGVPEFTRLGRASLRWVANRFAIRAVEPAAGVYPPKAGLPKPALSLFVLHLMPPRTLPGVRSQFMESAPDPNNVPS